MQKSSIILYMKNIIVIVAAFLIMLVQMSFIQSLKQTHRDNNRGFTPKPLPMLRIEIEPAKFVYFDGVLCRK